MRSRLAISAAAAAALGFLLPAAVAAQGQKGSYPWESQADRFYSRGADLPSYDPNAEAQRQLKKLGLVPNKPLSAPKAGAGTPALAAGQRRMGRLDTNHDGKVSQSEFLYSRVPSTRYTGAGRTRAQVARSRSLSQFRATDRDRNGTLSVEELSDERFVRY